MKYNKLIYVLLFIFLSSNILANENSNNDPLFVRNYYKYLRFDGNMLTSDPENIIPGISIGYRYFSKGHAIDLALEIASMQSGSTDICLTTLPRAMLLTYAHPHAQESFYHGIGISCSSFIKKDYVEDEYYWDRHEIIKKQFTGLCAEICMGYEMMRTSSIRTFVESNISLPMLKIESRSNNYSPVVKLGIGFGY